MKKYLPEIEKDEILSIPQFFIDSIIARDKKSEDHKDLGTLLAWAQNVEPIQKIGIPLPKILPKISDNIFILPNEKPKIDFIPSNLGIIDTNIKYDLILDELPIDMSLITKREIEQLPQNENNYQLILTFLDSNKNNSYQRFF